MPPSSPALPRRRSHVSRTEAALLALLLAFQVWLAASVSPRLSLAGDENAHLVGGFGHWIHNDYRMHAENGVLAQRWTALPLLALRPAGLPTVTDPVWRDADYVAASQAFLFAPGNDLDAILLWSRLMNALLGAAVTVTVFLWARSLFGPAAGWVSAALAAFCPNLLAHAGLANSDITISLAYLLALSAWWRLAHAITPTRVVLAGLALGILATAKFSGVFFAFIGPPLLLLRQLHPAPLRLALGSIRLRLAGLRKALALFASAAATLLVALAVVWAAYGFRYSASADGARPPIWDDIVAHHEKAGGAFPAVFGVAREHHLLPEAWLQGLAYVKWASTYRRAYLSGDYRTDGWIEFFPVAFLIKTPLGALGLLALAAVLFARLDRGRPARFLYRCAPLLGFAVVFGAFALTSSINIGLRHILPLYPAFYILAGSLALHAAAPGRLALRAAIAVLLFAHATAALSVRPHYLAFFNSLVGGPDQGHRHLVDSSLDWGQALPDLHAWLDIYAAPGEHIHLSYFGNDRPSRHGIQAVRTGDSAFASGLVPDLFPVLDAGLYCISATQFRQLYVWHHGSWSTSHERRYQQLLRVHRDAFAPRRQPGATYVTSEFDDLRFGRLCHFLNRRPPEAIVAHSILVFRLTRADLEHYLLGAIDANAPAPSGSPHS